MLEPFDIIVGALDNIETRRLLLDASRDLGIPYIDMGISQNSGAVAWTNGTHSDMQYAVKLEGDEDKEEVKEPACALIASRLMSAAVTECAVKSIFIYLSGHDPAYVVQELLGRDAKNGDMTSWGMVYGGGSFIATPRFVGNHNDGGDNDSEG